MILINSLAYTLSQLDTEAHDFHMYLVEVDNITTSYDNYMCKVDAVDTNFYRITYIFNKYEDTIKPGEDTPEVIESIGHKFIITKVLYDLLLLNAKKAIPFYDPNTLAIDEALVGALLSN